MTALAIAPQPSARPVAWRRLAWVAWRRYRTTLIATVGVLSLVAAYLLVSGIQIHSDYSGWRSCTPRNSASCNFALTNFLNRYGSSGLLGFVQVITPGLVGAFIGAPLLARELETGTFRYAWTQGVGRMRWTLAMLSPGIVGSAAIMAAFGVLVAWRNQPLVDAGIAVRMGGTHFPAVPPAAIGWALLAFATGVLAGLLWRRVLPALATTIVVWFGLAVLVSQGLRNHYLPPLTTTKLLFNSTDLTVGVGWTKGGQHVRPGQLNQILQAAGIQGLPSGNTQAAPGTGVVDPIQYLIQHGYTQVTSYQPAGRFEAFQWIEFGWLTLLTALLLTATVLLLYRRQA
jgi:hypothetical protein